MNNTVVITESGFPSWELMYPNNELHSVNYACFYSGRGFENIYKVWKSTYERKTTINLLNVDEFYEETYPILEFEFVDRGLGWFRKFLNKGWDDNKIYEVRIKKIGDKKITHIKMNSGKEYLADQDYSEIKKLIDNIDLTGNSK